MGIRIPAKCAWGLLLLAVAAAGTGLAAWLAHRDSTGLEAFAKRLGYTCQREGARFALASEDGRLLEMSVGEKRAVLDGTVVYLTYPVKEGWQGGGRVSDVDVETLLLPILRPVPPAEGRAIRRIVLDPGHGGESEPGAEYGGVREKDLVLEVAARLSRRLGERGYQVLATRNGDETVSLERRTAFANGAEADLFISIHFNASDGTPFRGIETYVANPAGTPSLRGAIGHVAPSNAFDGENALLGYLVQRHLAARTGLVDQGLKRVQFFVLRNVACPAFLAECGCLSDPEDFAVITQSAHWDAVADAIADAVDEFARCLAGHFAAQPPP